ncbi:MAG: TM2 domain-containing protein [Lentisphaerae bacterium]|nr:TM2 domain-containing protein [Lentisphaerota bacterium]
MKVYDKNEIPPGYKQKDRTTYILLAIFFYGLGLHEFYIGNTKGGIGYICCYFIGNLWFFGGLLGEGSIYFFPLAILCGLFIGMIYSVIKVDRDANGVLLK